MARESKKRSRGRPCIDPARKKGESTVLMARMPDELVKVVDEIGKEQGARGRSEALRKAIEVLRELKAKKK